MSNQVQSIVSQIVDWYAEERAGLLTLNVDDIPDIHLNELCAMMLSQDDDLVSEASGPDNPEWEKSMQHAVIKAMQDEYFAMMDFPDIWTAGIRSYLKPMIAKMIKEKLEYLNEDRECHTSLIWDRASEKTLEIASRM